MATLRGAESAAFTQVPEVRQTGTEWVGGEGEGEGDRRGKVEEEEEERVRGALDSSPRRHADLNGGLAPGARRRRPPSTAS